MHTWNSEHFVVILCIPCLYLSTFTPNKFWLLEYLYTHICKLFQVSDLFYIIQYLCETLISGQICHHHCHNVCMPQYVSRAGSDDLIVSICILKDYLERWYTEIAHRRYVQCPERSWHNNELKSDTLLNGWLHLRNLIHSSALYECIYEF